MSGEQQPQFRLREGEHARFTGDAPQLTLSHQFPGREDMDRAANVSATFLPASPDEESSLPAVQIANLLVFVYVKDGELCLTVDTEDAGGSCAVHRRVTGHPPEEGAFLDLRVRVNDGEVCKTTVDVS